MKKIFLIFSLIFILSGCSIDWNGEKDKKIVKLEKQIEDNSFKKNKECIELEPKMRKQLLELGSLHGVSSIDEIFYSKKDNTCYYTSYGTNGYILFNYFSNNFSDSAIISNSNDIQRLKEKIKKLKGE